MGSYAKEHCEKCEVLDKEFYSMSQLAVLFQVHRSTISRLISDGELAYIQIKNSKRIPRWEVQRFIDNQIESRPGKVRGE